MPEPDLIELFVQPLNRYGIRYLVSGSVASMLYGEPRVTHDIDLIVVLRPENLGQLPAAYPATDFYLPPAEVIAIEMDPLTGQREKHTGRAIPPQLSCAGRAERNQMQKGMRAWPRMEHG
jgi:hypothetical protein